jgi:hypothetical protein
LEEGPQRVIKEIIIFEYKQKSEIG